MSLAVPEKSIEYTPEQSLAITTRDVSVALAAGAGCGKTFVLTQRFLEELAPVPGRDPIQRLRELVAITFTDAAARELRTRVRRQCHAAWQRSSGTERDYWQKLIRSFDSCRISTIHSFCGNLLRAHPFEAGIDPLATVLEGAAAMVLEAEAIDDTLRGLLATRDDDAMLLATTWNIDGVRRRVAQMMKEYRHPEFRRWQSGTPEELLEVWREFYDGQVWPAARASWSPLASLLREDLLEFPYHAKVEPAKLRLLELLERVLAETLTADELSDLVGLCGVQRNFTKPKWEDEERYNHFKDNATRLRDAIKKLGTIDLESEGSRAAAELGIGLVRVTARAAHTYEQVKQSRGALDFDDLLARTHQLLTAPETQSVQRDVSSGIALLMVDEFQDTNRQQVEIVRAIVGHAAESGRLFFVGDEKQSIYRFRGAEPQVFHELRGEVTQQGRLPLSMNFRTQPAVLRFVNHLFEQTFAPHYQALVASRPQVTTPPGVEFLWTLVEGHAGIAGWAESCRRAEARGIARRLRELLDDQAPMVADPAAPTGTRGVRAGDVAILFRALSDVQYYEEALRDEGIEYYMVGGHAFYSQQEIYDVLHLLRVVVSRCDEVSLAGVLRSPFFSLADETLYWLVAAHGSLEAGLFADAVPADIEAGEQRKVASARDTLSHLRRLKDQATVPELLSAALDRTGYDAALLAEFMGERKLANVYKLIEQARASASSGVASVDQFVTQLARFTVDQPREALATTTPEAADVVRLMTIHMAKGLEFPVVLVPDINRKLAPSRVQALFHPQLGPLAKGDDTESAGTTGLDLFRKIDQIDSEAESQRLFYVACTRAKDQLILSGSTGNLDEKRQNWLEVLARAYDLGTGVPLGTSAAVSESNEPLVSVVFADSEPGRGGRQGGRPRSLERLLTKVRAQASKPSPPHAASADPVPFDPAWRRRFSVTRLSGRIIPSDHEWWSDEEASEAEGGVVDPIGFGTLVHAVLERLDLDRPDEIAQWCQALAPQHDILHTSQAATEAEGLVERFLRSSRGADLRHARRVEREVEFMMSWPLGATAAQSRFIQGYLDCLYQGEDGKWRIVDYKTNNVAASGVAKLAENYELQMLAYALAIEQCWGHGPDELVLHFLRPGEEHVIEWDASTRRRAIERIDQAIAEAQQKTLA